MIKAIDVVMLTKNSGSQLNRCLDSVYKNIPVNHLIVVDAFSSDNTIEVIEKFKKRYGNVRIIIDDGSRGRARQIGIQQVETEWFAFVDSDVVLCADWFEKATQCIRSDVGAVWGVDVPEGVNGNLTTKLFRWMEARVFDIRGGCHDILIRRDAVKNIEIPSRLHTLEDAYIKEWISGKNYKVLTSNLAFCLHCKTMNALLSRENRISTILELKNMRLVRERLVFAVVFSFMWMMHEVRSRNGKSHLT